MKKWGILLNVIVTGMILASCSSKSEPSGEDAAMEGATNVTLVSSVSLDSSGGDSTLRIESSQEPKYNVFKLADPDRVVIDLIDARLGEGVAATLAGQNGVSEVKVQGLEDSLSTLVRIEIYLASSMNYLASAEGNALSVRLIGPASSPAAEGEPMASNDAGMAPLPVPETTVEPVMPPAPMPEAAPAPAPMPEVPPAPAPMAEAPPAPEMMAATEAPVLEASPAVPVPVPVPVPMPAPMAEAEMAAPPMPIPLPEAKPEETSERQKPNLPSTRDLNAIPKRLSTQEIPSSGLTEGTSLLAELDTKVYTGRRVSLEFQNADVQDVIRLIAEVSKLNIIVGEDVKGNLTLKLIDVPWDQALDIILTTLQLDKVQHGNILRVAPAEKLKKERETALANDKAAKQLEPLKLKLINVNYAKGDEMKDRIKNLLSERGTVDVDSRTNTMIVKDIRENLTRVENLIKVLDTQTPQVRIESRIVQANDTFTRNLGIQWGPSLSLDATNGYATDWKFPYGIGVGGVPSGQTGSTVSNFAVDAVTGSTGNQLGFRLGSVNGFFNLDLRLSYAEAESMARVISRPSISVLDNRTARIIQGSKIPFLSQGSDGASVSFQEAGIEIGVTPQITNDGSVILKVSTKSNEPGSGDVGGNRIILIREANTEMLVKSGRTAVLGGVFRTSENQSITGVPGLKDIPVLGWLFKGQDKGNSREELLIFITPYILADNRASAPTPSSDSSLEPQ